VAITPTQQSDNELFDLETGNNAAESNFQDFSDVVLTPQAQVQVETDITNSNFHMGSHDTRGPIQEQSETGGGVVLDETDQSINSYEVRVSREILDAAINAEGPAAIPVGFDAGGSNDAFLVIENVPAGFEPSVGTRNEDRGDIRAQKTDLDIEAASGNEDGAIALNIDAALTDTDGSEELSIVIAGVPEGAELSAGTDNGDGTWKIEFSSGFIEEQADGYVALSDDASGTITMADGSELQFDGIERIEW